MAKRVTFISNKTVKEPTIVNFNTKNGKVSFVAKKNVQKPQIVSFVTKENKKK